MPKRKTTTKKTTRKAPVRQSQTVNKDKSNNNSNQNTLQVHIHGGQATTRKQTSKKGVQSYSKGNSYLGGTAMRGVNYPSTTVINNMPPTPMMFPQMETNRISAIENGMNNLYADIQGLYGKLNAPNEQEVKSAISQLSDPLTKSIVESRASGNIPTVNMSIATSSSTSTPTFGGSTSSDDSSGGGNLPVPSQTMYDASDAFETPKSMSMSVPTAMRTIPEFEEESLASNSPGTVSPTIQSLNRFHNPNAPTGMSAAIGDGDTIGLTQPLTQSTIDVNPSSKGKSIKVKPETKSDPESPPSSKESPSSVNKPSKPNKKEINKKAMQTRFDEIMDSMNYIATKDKLMSNMEKEQATKGYYDELSDMFFKLHPRSKKEPKSIEKLKLAINKKLYVDSK